jgi:hypothetical protein
MNAIEVMLLVGTQIAASTKGESAIAADIPAETAIISFDELHNLLLRLTEGEVQFTRAELKQQIKKLKHQVLVMAIKDVVDATTHHVWLMNPSGLTRTGNAEGSIPEKSILGNLSVAPGVMQ